MKRLLAFVPVSALLVACGGMVTAPPAPTEAKNTPPAASTYPAGPYGYQVGNVIEDLEFVGQHNDNPTTSWADNQVHSIHLSDYLAKPTTKVLVVLVAAEWCNPCRGEQAGLVQLYNDYKAADAGVEFVEAIIESIYKDSRGNYLPADVATIDRWGNTGWKDPLVNNNAPMKIPFDLVADPTVALGPYYVIEAFPMQMVITTADMKIQYQNNGQANDQLQSAIDSALGN